MGRITKIGFAVLALALVAWAGDAWREKPYQQWDENDVRKVLNDSPWAKQISVLASWSSAGPEAGQSAQDNSGPGYGGGRPMGGSSSEGGEAQQSNLPAQAVFEIRWASSRTIREALARAALLNGKLGQAEAEKYVAQEPADYQVSLFGPDMTPFAQSEETSLKRDAYLAMKKSKAKLAPSRVEITRSEDGKKIISLTFMFPKKAQNGELTIGSQEKSLEFVCHAGQASLHATFELQKMSDQQGRDL